MTPVEHRSETASYQTRGKKSRRLGSSSGQAAGGSHWKVEQTSTGNGKTGINFANILRAAFSCDSHTQIFVLYDKVHSSLLQEIWRNGLKNQWSTTGKCHKERGGGAGKSQKSVTYYLNGL